MKLNKLIILSLNCHSVRSQSISAPLQARVEEHQADIVTRCESHLDDQEQRKVVNSGVLISQQEKNSILKIESYGELLK